MNQATLDQYTVLKAKKTLSAEETAVVNAIVTEAAEEDKIIKAITNPPETLAEAQDVLEDAKEALVNKPSTTV